MKISTGKLNIKSNELILRNSTPLRAIALSLQHTSSPIVISDDEDADFQRDIQRAIEASKSTPRTVSSSQLPSVFISERAVMERERLDRQKRLRKEAGLDDEDDMSTKRLHLPSEGSPVIPSKISSKGTSIPTIDQIFWEGEVRQIANKYAEPRDDGRPTFRLTEILGKVRLYPSLHRILHYSR